MKKFLSVILSFLFIFLCSCSLLPKVTETATITFEQLGDKSIQNIAVNDKYLLILALDYEECSGEDAEYSDTIDKPDINYYFYIWNINLNKLKSEYSSSSKEFDYISDIKLSDDNEITVYTFDDKPESKIYDLSFNEIGTTKETAKSIMDANDKLVEENELIDADTYTVHNNVAYFSKYINNDLIVFLNDDQNIYISEIDNSNYIVDCIESKVYRISNDQAKTIKYSYTDYENNISKEISMKYDIDFYPSYLAVGNTYSVIALQNEMGQIKDITIINNSAMTEKAVNNIEKINIKEIDGKIAELENKIQNDYDIDIEVCKEYNQNSIINSYVYNNDYSNKELLLMLLDFDYCLSTFPKGLYREIINRDGILTSFSKLKLYIVGSFDNEKNDTDVSAYCSNSGDEIFIVYSISDFNIKNFYHEFMHAMEYRIWDYANDFEDEWLKLNPEEFEYTYGDKDMTPYYDHDDYQNYFANDYATTNPLEDRATVFQDLCASAFYEEESPYWADRKPILKKAKYLKSIITKSFPSMADNNFTVWEMYDEILG